MNYLKTSSFFKIKKVFRYILIYGPSKTYIKIRGQIHMNGKVNNFPGCNIPLSSEGIPQGKVGLIGCGNFAFTTIAYYLQKISSGCIRACMDQDINKAGSLFKYYNLTYYTDDANLIISDPDIKLVYIASNHASHAEYAIDCIRSGKHVHIEKPHVVSEDQLVRLCNTMLDYPKANVFLGFNRPKSPLFKKLLSELSFENGPIMVNWFIAGHEISDDHWYYDSREGGRVLGNLCHWTDLTLHLVSIEKAFPCRINSSTPLNSVSDFVVNVSFADQSCAAFTFSAKGHTFEGVRETLQVHKGNLLGFMKDFQSLKIEKNTSKKQTNLLFRNHGHRENIHNSFSSTFHNNIGESLEYVHATAKFFLGIKKSIETGEEVVITEENAFVVENKYQDK